MNGEHNDNGKSRWIGVLLIVCVGASGYILWDLRDIKKDVADAKRDSGNALQLVTDAARMDAAITALQANQETIKSRISGLENQVSNNTNFIHETNDIATTVQLEQARRTTRISTLEARVDKHDEFRERLLELERGKPR